MIHNREIRYRNWLTLNDVAETAQLLSVKLVNDGPSDL